MFKLIKYKLRKGLLNESFNIGFRLPKQNDSLNNETINKLKNINKNDIDIEQIGDDGNNIVNLEVKIKNIPEVKDLIIVDIQIINDKLYQPHISMADSIQGLGLAPKIYVRLIEEFGHLYSGKGRVYNKNIFKVWDKLNNESNIVCKDLDYGNICILNRNIEYLKKFGLK